ncbi:MAG: CdaR family protein [Acidobacteriota bacterium]|nr:CdaR family protein [Acidobacteriota bacterium]
MSFPTEKIFDKQIRRSFLRRLFRRVFLEDWLTKVIAVLITLALWLGVTGLRAPITIRLPNVPLTVRYSNDTAVTNSLAQEVDLVITGDKRKIDQINKNDLVILLDLSNVPAGDRTVLLAPDNVNIELPTGVRLDEIQPNEIAVRLEAVEEREIPVKAETEGTVAENFEIYNQTVVPQKVRVRGPASFVKSLDSASTEKINIENRTADFNARQVELNLVNPKVTLLDTVVDVIFKIGENRIERLFLIPVKNENQNKTATVILYGARSILEAIQPESLQIENLKAASGETSPRLILPIELQNKVEIRKLQVK